MIRLSRKVAASRTPVFDRSKSAVSKGVPMTTYFTHSGIRCSAFCADETYLSRCKLPVHNGYAANWTLALLLIGGRDAISPSPVGFVRHHQQPTECIRRDPRIELWRTQDGLSAKG